MNKHEEARKLLNKYRNSNYNAPISSIELELSKAIDDLLPYISIVEFKLESKEKELELYKAFVKEFGFFIITEQNFNDPENQEEEYLEVGGATDKAIELFKEIYKLSKGVVGEELDTRKSHLPISTGNTRG